MATRPCREHVTGTKTVVRNLASSSEGICPSTSATARSMNAFVAYGCGPAEVVGAATRPISLGERRSFGFAARRAGRTHVKGRLPPDSRQCHSALTYGKFARPCLAHVAQPLRTHRTRGIRPLAERPSARSTPRSSRGPLVYYVDRSSGNSMPFYAVPRGPASSAQPSMKVIGDPGNRRFSRDPPPRFTP